MEEDKKANKSKFILLSIILIVILSGLSVIFIPKLLKKEEINQNESTEQELTPPAVEDSGTITYNFAPIIKETYETTFLQEEYPAIKENETYISNKKMIHYDDEIQIYTQNNIIYLNNNEEKYKIDNLPQIKDIEILKYDSFIEIYILSNDNKLYSVEYDYRNLYFYSYNIKNINKIDKKIYYHEPHEDFSITAIYIQTLENEYYYLSNSNLTHIILEENAIKEIDAIPEKITKTGIKYVTYYPNFNNVKKVINNERKYFEIGMFIEIKNGIIKISSVDDNIVYTFKNINNIKEAQMYESSMEENIYFLTNENELYKFDIDFKKIYKIDIENINMIDIDEYLGIEAPSFAGLLIKTNDGKYYKEFENKLYELVYDENKITSIDTSSLEKITASTKTVGDDLIEACRITDDYLNFYEIHDYNIEIELKEKKVYINYFDEIYELEINNVDKIYHDERGGKELYVLTTEKSIYKIILGEKNILSIKEFVTDINIQDGYISTNNEFTNICTDSNNVYQIDNKTDEFYKLIE